MAAQILRRRVVTSRTGLSSSSLNRLELAGNFPPRVRLGPCAVGWLEDEVTQWIADRVSARDAEVAAGADRRSPSGGWLRGRRAAA